MKNLLAKTLAAAWICAGLAACSSDDDDNTYAIYFNITQPDGHDEGYEYRVWAKDIDEALGIFFTENPNINYNMVLDHDEI